MSLNVPRECVWEGLTSNLGQIPAYFWRQLAGLHHHPQIIMGQVNGDLLSAATLLSVEDAEVTEMSLLSQELKSIAEKGD